MQQVAALRKNQALKPKSLLEKFSAGGRGMDTDKFREIVMSGGERDSGEGVQSLLKEGAASAAPCGNNLEL